MKRVLAIGNCGADEFTLRRYLQQQFGRELVAVDNEQQAQETLQAGDVALVIVNRVLDLDGSSGLDIIRQLKADPATAALPVMLLTNYADQQQLAVEAGALPGFGKSQYGDPHTRERLAAVLERERE